MHYTYQYVDQELIRVTLLDSSIRPVFLRVLPSSTAIMRKGSQEYFYVPVDDFPGFLKKVEHLNGELRSSPSFSIEEFSTKQLLVFAEMVDGTLNNPVCEPIHDRMRMWKGLIKKRLWPENTASE